MFSFFSSITWAQPPYGPDMILTPDGVYNEWEVTYYYDNDSGLIGGNSHTQGNTQKLCFFYAGTVDSHQRYYVVSSSYNGWFGTTTQEGDLVRIKMTFWNGDGNDEMSFNLSTMGAKDRGMGHWDETVETWTPFGYTYWGNTELRRTGKCKFSGSKDYTADEIELAEEMRGKNAERLRMSKSPMGKTRTSIK